MHRQIKLGVIVLMSLLIGWGFSSPLNASSAFIESATSGESLLQAKVPDKLTFSKGKNPGDVSFDHKAHATRAESGKGCAECHHTSTNAKLKTEAPPKCASCHMVQGNAKNPKVKGKEIWMREAFHNNCMECHKQVKKGPVKCLDCHVKKT